jgi:hypothetical protein
MTESAVLQSEELIAVRFIGEISSEPDPPGINKARWIELIREYPNLDPVPPREGTNPFTRKPMVIYPRADIARVVVAGKDVGTMSWAEDESNLINVFGEPEVVVPLACDIARLLGGHFKEHRDE